VTNIVTNIVTKWES